MYLYMSVCVCMHTCVYVFVCLFVCLHLYVILHVFSHKKTLRLIDENSYKREKNKGGKKEQKKQRKKVKDCIIKIKRGRIYHQK